MRLCNQIWLWKWIIALEIEEVTREEIRCVGGVIIANKDLEFITLPKLKNPRSRRICYKTIMTAALAKIERGQLTQGKDLLDRREADPVRPMNVKHSI